MMCPLSPRKAAGVVAAAFVATVLFAPASYAQSGSLSLEQTTPAIQFDFDGQIRYAGGVLEVDASPLVVQAVDFLPPAVISDVVDSSGLVTLPRDFRIRVQVDNAGNLLGGNDIPGEDDIVIQGHAFGPGTNFSGILLRGKVRPASGPAQECRPTPTTGPCRGFGFLEGPSGTDFEFRFEVTGGLLDPYFENDLHVRATSIGLLLTGGFATPFASAPEGGFPAEGSAGQVALPLGELFPPTVTGANVTATAMSPSGAPAILAVTATSASGLPLTPTCVAAPGSLLPPMPIPINVPYVFPVGVSTINCSATDSGGTGRLTLTVTVVFAPPVSPPVLTVTDATVEATGPFTPVTYNVSAFDAMGPLPVMCDLPSGWSFFLGMTNVSCSATNAGGTTTKILNITVQDTTPPVILGGSRVEVEADSAGGATVVLPWIAKDLATGDLPLPVTCDNLPPASLFPVGTTYLLCHADDGRGNRVSETFEVTVTVEPPKFPGGACFVVDFREITYFRNQAVLTSSDAAIRTAAGIAGAFNPALWPYRASGGAGYTRSKGTLFRLYGFQPSEIGQLIPDADESFTSYPVEYDAEAKGYYIDLGGPARVFVCPDQLHNYVLAGLKGNGHVDGSTLLPISQRNVPGVMLTRNSQILKLPRRIRLELIALGMDPGPRGLIDYIGFQLQGNGNAEFREFVDLEISFPGDSLADRREHFTSGLHTATNVNFESFAGCNYVDSAPGNDAVRLRDIWGPNRSRKQGYQNWRACGTREPSVNKKVRANYEVAFNAIQLLPTVNSGVDTLRIYFGEIRPVVATERQKRDHWSDWREWDLWDF